MTDISAALVKALRDRTGAAMMDCKKALTVTNGDLEAAIIEMRKSGQAKADKKASRVAAEGVVKVRISKCGRKIAMLEMNCETDFVAKDVQFNQLADQIVDFVLSSGITDIPTLLSKHFPNQTEHTIDETRKALVAKIGENMSVRRAAYIKTEGTVGSYVHGDRIGAVVELSCGDIDTAKDVAIHVAASNPLVISPQEVSEEDCAREAEIARSQATTAGKPANIVEKMVEGRVKKFVEEVSLLGQDFVKDPAKKVGAMLDAKGAKVKQFIRFKVGEGIEKEVVDFAQEVMSVASKA
jgi:elongation factor Ts